MAITEGFALFILVSYVLAQIFLGLLAGALSAILFRIPYNMRSAMKDIMFAIMGIAIVAVIGIIQLRQHNYVSVIPWAFMVAILVPVVRHALQWLRQRR